MKWSGFDLDWGLEGFVEVCCIRLNFLLSAGVLVPSSCSLSRTQEVFGCRGYLADQSELPSQHNGVLNITTSHCVLKSNVFHDKTFK